MLLLTGQRVNEVAQLEWQELDLANRVWNLPAARSKNGKAHIVHLSDKAIEIIKTLPQINNSKYVFTWDGTTPYRNSSYLHHRMHKLMDEGTLPWQLRDLRRTATTLMAEIGIPHHVADKVLNHIGGEISGVKAIYNRFEYLDERKSALDALARKIEQLIAGNVVRLRA